jgi:thioredoxin-related protein
MIKVFILLITILGISIAQNVNVDNFVKDAKKSGKHVLIFLHKPNCGYCERMIDFTIEDEKVESEIGENFTFIDMNIADEGNVSFDGSRGTIKEFAKFVGNDFYPNVIFIDGNKEIVYTQPAYQDEKTFFNILRYIDSRSYEDMGIEEFKQKK